MRAQDISLKQHFEQLFKEVMEFKLRMEMEKDEEEQFLEEEMSFEAESDWLQSLRVILLIFTACTICFQYQHEYIIILPVIAVATAGLWEEIFLGFSVCCYDVINFKKVTLKSWSLQII